VDGILGHLGVIRTTPPFARIDHAFVGRHVSRPHPVHETIPGTDHRALEVTVSPAA